MACCFSDFTSYEPGTGQPIYGVRNNDTGAVTWWRGDGTAYAGDPLLLEGPPQAAAAAAISQYFPYVAAAAPVGPDPCEPEVPADDTIPSISVDNDGRMWTRPAGGPWTMQREPQSIGYFATANPTMTGVLTPAPNVNDTFESAETTLTITNPGSCGSAVANIYFGSAGFELDDMQGDWLLDVGLQVSFGGAAGPFTTQATERFDVRNDVGSTSTSDPGRSAVLLGGAYYISAVTIAAGASITVNSRYQIVVNGTSAAGAGTLQGNGLSILAVLEQQ